MACLANMGGPAESLEERLRLAARPLGGSQGPSDFEHDVLGLAFLTNISNHAALILGLEHA